MEERVGLMKGSTAFVQLPGLFLLSCRSFFISQFRDKCSEQLSHIPFVAFWQGLVLGLSDAARVLLTVLLFVNTPPLFFSPPVKFVFAICFGLENNLALLAIWTYSGYLAVASDFSEASR